MNPQPRFTRLFSSALLLLFFLLPAQAQTADELFEAGQYRQAAQAYERSAASDASAYRGAARSYTALRNWDQAIAMYERYRDNASGANASEVNELIALLRAPEEDLYVENVGANVNTATGEYSPRVSADGRRLYFISNDRPGGRGGEDAWYSEIGGDGEWGVPQNLGSVINTESHDALLSISANGQVAIIFGNYEGRFGSSDLFYSARNGDSWTVPCNLGGDINGPNWDSQANLAPDGKTLLFVAYKDRGSGESSNWTAHTFISHLRDGRWTPAKPLPAPVNLPNYDTVWPFLSADGRTLYFASERQPSLGEKDLFMTRRLGDGWDQWTEPVNLGKSINSVKNDQNLTIPAAGTVAYFNRETTGDGDGYGGADLFRMILPPEMRPQPVVGVSGVVTNQEDHTIAATLRWSDFDTGESLGYSTSNSFDGTYYLTLPYGRRYLITIDQRGYLFQTEMLDLREVEAGMMAFADQLGPERPAALAALAEVERISGQMKDLVASSSTDLDARFDEVKQQRGDLDAAYQRLNAALRRAQVRYLEMNSGYKEVTKNIQLTEATEGARLVLRNIYFNTGSAELRPESEQELDRLVEIMRNSTLSVEIGGHTDNTGTASGNQSLSQRRAESVRAYVVEAGIPAARITARGYGQEDPIATNDTEEGRQMNRRVEVKITGTGGREGAGDLMAEEEAAMPQGEDLYELYRQAALAGGLPRNAACYARNEQPDLASRRIVEDDDDGGFFGGGRRPSARGGSDRLHNAMGAFNVQFASLGGAGLLRGMGQGGVALYYSGNKSENLIEGYFLDSEYGGRYESLRYVDLGGFVGGLPLSLDTGFGLAGVFRSDEEDFGNTTLTTNFVSIAGYIPVRVRYNLAFGDIALSPYGQWAYNLASFLIDEDDNPRGDGDTRTFLFAPESALEVGAFAQWKFVSGGVGLHLGDYDGLTFRVGFGTGR